MCFIKVHLLFPLIQFLHSSTATPPSFMVSVLFGFDYLSSQPTQCCQLCIGTDSVREHSSFSGLTSLKTTDNISSGNHAFPTTFSSVEGTLWLLLPSKLGFCWLHLAQTGLQLAAILLRVPMCDSPRLWMTVFLQSIHYPMPFFCPICLSDFWILKSERINNGAQPRTDHFTVCNPLHLTSCGSWC